jgi:hypothetical protein
MDNVPFDELLVQKSCSHKSTCAIFEVFGHQQTKLAKSPDQKTDQNPHCLMGFCGIKAACRVVELGLKATKGSI